LIEAPFVDPSSRSSAAFFAFRRMGNECIAPTTTVIGTGPVRCRERLGDVLKF
jgi:hypothetical protein